MRMLMKTCGRASFPTPPTLKLIILQTREMWPRTQNDIILKSSKHQTQFYKHSNDVLFAVVIRHVTHMARKFVNDNGIWLNGILRNDVWLNGDLALCIIRLGTTHLQYNYTYWRNARKTEETFSIRGVFRSNDLILNGLFSLVMYGRSYVEAM